MLIVKPCFPFRNRGFIPRLIIYMSQGAIFFTSYEFFKQLLMEAGKVVNADRPCSPKVKLVGRHRCIRSMNDEKSFSLCALCHICMYDCWCWHPLFYFGSLFSVSRVKVSWFIIFCENNKICKPTPSVPPNLCRDWWLITNGIICFAVIW